MAVLTSLGLELFDKMFDVEVDDDDDEEEEDDELDDDFIGEFGLRYRF